MRRYIRKFTKLESVLLIIIGVLLVGIFVEKKSFAEQGGESPESGELSILKEIYTNLQTLGYGSDDGSNGAIWNRIISSANWVPNGTVAPDKVISGYTFYNGDRGEKVGTYNVPDYKAQSYQKVDGGIVSPAEWTKTNASPEVWKDKRTGLYWSPKQVSMTNSFTTVSCSFFSATSRGNYNGAESACGNAINACAALELDANSDGSMETDWYLPSQGELLQAYLDGMYLATSSSWATTDAFWSSTENQFSNTYAWISTFNQGYSNYAGKSTNNYVRCVRSD